LRAKWQKIERREDTVGKPLSADVSVSCLLKRMPSHSPFSASGASATLCDSLVTTTLSLLIHRKKYLRLSNPSLQVSFTKAIDATALDLEHTKSGV